MYLCVSAWFALVKKTVITFSLQQLKSSTVEWSREKEGEKVDVKWRKRQSRGKSEINEEHERKTEGRKDGVKSEKWQKSGIEKLQDFCFCDPMISTEKQSYIEKNLLTEAETFAELGIAWVTIRSKRKKKAGNKWKPLKFSQVAAALAVIWGLDWGTLHVIGVTLASATSLST